MRLQDIDVILHTVVMSEREHPCEIGSVLAQEFFIAIRQEYQRGRPKKDASTDVEMVHAVITED